MRRRRWTIGLSIAGGAIGAVFDAETVDASNYAYAHLQMPDAPQMMVTYALTAALASAGGAARATQIPALPIATAAKAAFDLATWLYMAREEWRTNHKLCSWCQIATAISTATVALTLPEAVRAARGQDAAASEELPLEGN